MNSIDLMDSMGITGAVVFVVCSFLQILFEQRKIGHYKMKWSYLLVPIFGMYVGLLMYGGLFMFLKYAKML